MRYIAFLVALLALYGCLPYVTSTIAIAHVQESDFAEASRVIHGLGYEDTELTHPRPTAAGFRSTAGSRFFLILESDRSKEQLELSFSQSANKFSDEATRKLDVLVAALQARFPDKITVSEPH